MADFKIAVAKTIKNEGGDKYTETEGDRGDATKYGISEKTMYVIVHDRYHHLECSTYLKDLLSPILKIESAKDKVKRLTMDQAKEIYKIFFWDANRYGEINDQSIAEKVFDMAVLMGAPQANKCLQKFFNWDHIGNGILGVDGIIGDITLECLNDDRCLNFVLNEFKLNCTKYFISICNKDKSQSKFLLGWLNRIMS